MLAGIAALALLGGCGSSHGSTSPAPASSTGAAQEGGGALAADARSAATGDIPDSQNFLTLKDSQLRLSMIYPEGWTVQRTGSAVTIQDKNNLVRISLTAGSRPTASDVRAQLAALKRLTPTLAAGAVRPVSLKSGPAVRASYTTQSAPNPVTGKSVKLTVDRYVLGHAGRVAVIDLGTPVGVDNVDAYKRMIESFKWL